MSDVPSLFYFDMLQAGHKVQEEQPLIWGAAVLAQTQGLTMEEATRVLPSELRVSQLLAILREVFPDWNPCK